MTTSNVRVLSIRRTSRLSGFHRLRPAERRQRLLESRWATPALLERLEGMGGIDEQSADAMVENMIGIHGLPLAVALNFQVNGAERVIPMAVEFIRARRGRTATEAVVEEIAEAAKDLRDPRG